MSKFSIKADKDFSAATYVHELWLAWRDDEDGPIKVHLHYSGAENRRFANLLNRELIRHQRQLSKAKASMVAIQRRIYREIYPENIVHKVENVPLTAGGVMDLTELADLKVFCEDLSETAFDELMTASSDITNFYEDAVSADAADEVAETMGESSGGS